MQSENKCADRNNRIDNCLTQNPNLDECMVCAEQYQITNDFLMCLKYIENCIQYQTTTKSDTAHVCLKCVNGYHLNSNKCVAGNIDFCQYYTDDSTYSNQICSKCFNKYYLSQNKCKIAETVQSCITNHPTVNKACLECDFNKQNFQLISYCTILTPIPNCISYSQKTPSMVCSECALGYKLN